MDLLHKALAFHGRGMVAFSDTLKEVSHNGHSKKTLGGQCKWSMVTLENMIIDHIHDDHNALLLKTGDISGIIAIDWDLYKCDATLKLYQDLVEKYGRPNTWIQQTANGGEHWLFNYESDKHAHVTSHNDTKVMGTSYKVDIKTNGGVLLVDPTQFRSIDGDIKKYSTVVPMDAVSDMPDWIYDVFDAFKPSATNDEDILPIDSVSNQMGPTNSFVPPSIADYNYVRELTKDLQILLDCLTVSRCDSYDDWIKVGFALHSITSIDTFSLWDEWSKRSQKYQPGECRRKWSGMQIDASAQRCTLGTLKFMAKHDNPNMYSSRFQHSDLFKQAMKVFSNSSVAELIYQFYDDAFLYDHHCEKWFELMSNNVWRDAKKTPLKLVNIIHKEFPRRIYDFISFLSSKAMLEDADRRVSTNNLIKMCIGNVKTLGHSMFAEGCAKASRVYYHKENVAAMMDSDRYLLAFSDVVYDLRTCQTRPIQPEDFVLTTTGYPFPSRDEEAMEEVATFIRSIFENREDELYLLKTLAGGLMGHNRFEELYIWSGRGANGKGTLYDLVQNAMGDYFKSIDISFFTKPKKNSSEATPELVNKTTCRFMFSTEPESSEMLQVAKIKELTGGDLVHARGLYEQSVSFRPQWSIFIQTNDMPRLSKIDGGIQRRLRILRFPFTFTQNPTEPHQRLGDPDVKEYRVRSDRWRNAFMVLLLDIYENFVKDASHIAMSASVQEATSEYMDSQNPLLTWLNTKCVRGRQFSIGATEAYDNFRNHTGHELSIVRFAQLMQFNGFDKKKTPTHNVYLGLQLLS
jgi:P4 family phage/plasmid primase-like protien